MLSTSSFAFPDGQLSLLHLTSLLPCTFQPMLLRVWNWTDHALAVAEARTTVKTIADVFIVLIKTNNVCGEILDQLLEGDRSGFGWVTFDIEENIASIIHD